MSGRLTGVDEHQPAPVKNDRESIQDMVIADLQNASVSLDRDPNIEDRAYALVVADIQARKEIGLKRYGTLLQAFNGRDALMDAYQEALDLCQYLRQVQEEGRWVNVTYENALKMTIHLRLLIEDRDHEIARAVTAFGDPARAE